MMENNKYELDDESFLNGWHDSVVKCNEFEDKILKRIEYIISTILFEFGCKFNGSYRFNNFEDYCYSCDRSPCYDCAKRISIYNFMSEVFMDSNIKFIEFNINNSKLRKAQIMINSSVINVLEKFPKKWVFQNFEPELKIAKQEYIDFFAQKENDILNKRKEKINNKDKKILLQEALKSKLTPEELELISFKK